MAKIFKSNAFYRSLNTFFYFFLNSRILIIYSTIFEFSFIYKLFHPHTLYTQLCRITLVAQVLPRLLAPVLATTSLCTQNHFFSTRMNFTTTIAFFIPTNSIGHTFVHCLTFFTAACRAFSCPMWLILLSNQLEIIGYNDAILIPLGETLNQQLNNSGQTKFKSLQLSQNI